MMFMRFKPRPLPSPLVGVTDEQWTSYVRALDVQPPNAVSSSGGFGSYDLRPRRLVELGYAINLRVTRLEGRQVYECDFVLPLTRKRLLADWRRQLAILCQSAKRHQEQLISGEIVKPEGVSLAGVLAILHVGGRGALKSWPNLFTETRALYDEAQGVF